MADICECLSPDAHVVLREICKCDLGKPDAAYDGLRVKTTGTHLRTRSGFCREHFDAAVEELASEGVLLLEPFRENSQIVVRERPSCACAPTHTRTGTRACSSRSSCKSSNSYEQQSSSPSGMRGVAPEDAEASTPRRKLSRKSSDPANWNGHALAHHLNEQVVLAWFGRQPGMVNIVAVRKQVSRWIHEGVSPATVKAMIDHFVADDANLPTNGVPVWKVFISARHRLMADVERVSVQATAEAHRGDRSWWLS